MPTAGAPDPGVRPVSLKARRRLAELLGTFVLVFAGTGAIVVNEASGGRVTHVGIALTFGLTVMALVYALGDVSGAHLNPAVTIGFWSARRFPGSEVLPYIGSQAAGALLASLVLRGAFPASRSLGATVPADSDIQAAVFELILTAILMFVILSVATGSKEKGVMAGAAIGSVIAFEALFAGPVSGASMNPARSLAPALVAWQFGSIWVYLVAPTLGALLAVQLCRRVQSPGCCSACAELG